MRQISRLKGPVRQTALDRVIGYVAPGLARDRLVARMQINALSGGGYLGGKRNRRQTQNWLPFGGDADADLLPDLAALRERSRDAGRNVPIAGAAVERDVLNTVGGGLWPQPEIDRETLGLDEEQASAWERQAQRIFWAWSDGRECDATGVQQFGEQQAMLLRAPLESGDCFTLRRFVDRPGRVLGLALQIYEADQVSNPHGWPDGTEIPAGQPGAGNTLTGGIETDRDTGARVAVYLQKTHPGIVSGRVKNEWARVPVDQAGQWAVLQHFERLRPNQARGVPMLAPVLETLKQLGDYTEAELMAAVLSAMIALVHKTPDGQPLQSPDPEDNVEPAQSGDQVKLKIGTILDLDDLSDVKSTTPGRPNGGFDPFFVAIVRQIGARLGLPFEVLIMHFTASYSASRAALEMAWQHFRRRRDWLIASCCEPVWEAFVTEAVARGYLAAPGFEDPLIRRAWLGCRWTGPKRISVDPKKEAEADAVEEDRGWKTAAQNAAERGNDFEAVHAARKREVEMRVADGLQAPPGAGAAASLGDTAAPARRRDPEDGSDREDPEDEAEDEGEEQDR